MNKLSIVGLSEGVPTELTAVVDNNITAVQDIPWGWLEPETQLSARRLFHFYPPEGETITGIAAQPTLGRAIINADNTITVQLTDVEITSPVADQIAYVTDVQTVTENYEVALPRMVDGWHNGDTYRQHVGLDGRQIIERDENTFVIHAALTGLSLTDIIALEPSMPTDPSAAYAWMIANNASGQSTPYGTTEALEVDEGVGRGMWKALTENESLCATLRFKGGELFNDQSEGFTQPNNANGFNSRFPLLIESYGTEKARVAFRGDAKNHNIVLRNMVADAATLGSLMRASLEDLDMVDGSSIGLSQGLDINGEPNGDGFSVRYCYGFDGYKRAPATAGLWQASPDRVTNFFFRNMHDFLMERCISDLSGWKPGYDASSNAAPGNDYDAYPQPPSQYSQGAYTKASYGMTFRSNLFSRGALTAKQTRSGAYDEGNVYLSYNVAGNFGGGIYFAPTDQFTGNFTCFTGNVLTDVGYKTSAAANGLSQQSRGMEFLHAPVTISKNVAMHARNPDDLAAEAFKASIGDPIFLKSGVALTVPDDTVVYGYDQHDRNLDGLDTATLDATSIQRFADQFMGDSVGTNTISTFMAHLSTLPNAGAVVPQIVEYFQTAAGVAPVARSAQTLIFDPEDRFDGIRWDNPNNWSDVDGLRDGDSVDLNGFHTRLGCADAVVANLDFGLNGMLTVNNSQVEIGDLTTTDGAATLEAEGCGNIVISGAAAPINNLTTNVSVGDKTYGAGRVVVTGSLAGSCDVFVENHGQFFAYDGGDITIGNGNILQVTGANARVGFDGTNGGVSVITMAAGSTLRLVGSNGDLPTIKEVWSGMNEGVARSVASTFVCGGTLDLRGLPNGTYEAIIADTVTGTFASVLGGVAIYGEGSVTVEV